MFSFSILCWLGVVFVIRSFFIKLNENLWLKNVSHLLKAKSQQKKKKLVTYLGFYSNIGIEQMPSLFYFCSFHLKVFFLKQKKVSVFFLIWFIIVTKYIFITKSTLLSWMKLCQFKSTIVKNLLHQNKTVKNSSIDFPF